MSIPSKFSNWHAPFFFLSSQYCHIHGMHLICFFEDCKTCFALVVNCCKSNKTFRNQCSIFNHNFLLYSGFPFPCRKNSMPYDACIQKEHPIYVNILQKKVFNIDNFANMFLFHKVKIVLLDNTIYPFSSTRII